MGKRAESVRWDRRSEGGELAKAGEFKNTSVGYSLGSRGLVTSQGHRMSLAEAGNSRGDMAGGGAEGLLIYPFVPGS